MLAAEGTMTNRSALFWLSGVGLALTLAGCGQRPSQLCHQFVGEWQAMLDRCEIVFVGEGTPSEHFEIVPGAEAWRFYLVEAEPPHDPVSCDNVSRASNVAELERSCYPWLRGEMCPDLVYAMNNGIMSACRADGYFTFLDDD